MILSMLHRENKSRQIYVLVFSGKKMDINQTGAVSYSSAQEKFPLNVKLFYGWKD